MASANNRRCEQLLPHERQSQGGGRPIPSRSDPITSRSSIASSLARHWQAPLHLSTRRCASCAMYTRQLAGSALGMIVRRCVPIGGCAQGLEPSGAASSMTGACRLAMQRPSGQWLARRRPASGHRVGAALSIPRFASGNQREWACKLASGLLPQLPMGLAVDHTPTDDGVPEPRRHGPSCTKIDARAPGLRVDWAAASAGCIRNRAPGNHSLTFTVS
jgi:hypothetical protein